MDNLKIITLIFSFIMLNSILSGQSKLVLNIDKSSDYLCYYGSWNDEKIFRGKDFDMIILEPSAISAANILKLRCGHDEVLGTDDDVIVIGYLSVGEDHSSSNKGNGSGPCYYDYNLSKLVYQNKGLASWYVDDKDKNGIPDADPIWKSAYVNAGDTLWWQYLKTYNNGADATLKVKGCDGLFLDLLDIASPWYPWPYRWTVKGMSDLVKWLKQTYPDKYLIGNRGLFYFDPSIPEAYNYNIRRYIDGIMFESYFIENDRKGWAQKLNKEAQKSDGFKVISLDYTDYLNPSQVSQQISESFSYNWTTLISVVSLSKFPYEVFHRHTPDLNPPTWDGIIGLKSASPKGESVNLTWGKLTDSSLPLKFDIYYTKDAVFSFESAQVISDIHPDYDSSSGTYSYTVSGLLYPSYYNFVIRIIDAAGNSEHNAKVFSATVTRVDENTIVEKFHLYQNYPNPFNSSTIISFEVSEHSYVRLEIANSLGQRVAELVNGHLDNGYYSYPFSSDDLSSGTYFYRLLFNGQVFTKKMLVLK